MPYMSMAVGYGPQKLPGGIKWVGAERGALWVRFFTPPVAAAPETFASCSYRTEILFRLRFIFSFR
jgi:hypothetical protein